jgi:hypothetical protein
MVAGAMSSVLGRAASSRHAAEVVVAIAPKVQAEPAALPLAFPGPLPYNAAFREPPGQQACRGGF